MVSVSVSIAVASIGRTCASRRAQPDDSVLGALATVATLEGGGEYG